jgi:cytochrome c6
MAAAQNRRSGGISEGAEFESGRQQYHRTCAQCHGRNMINSGNTVYDLRRFPQDQPDRFFQSVTKGKGNMPSFQEALSPEQMDGLWHYVRNRGEPPR